MALSQSILADELADALEGLAGDASLSPGVMWAQAFGAYFEGATVAGTPIAAAVLPAAKAAMASALSFSPGSASSGAATIVSGLAAFWASIQTSAATAWPGYITGAQPSGLSSLAAELLNVFATNMTVTSSQAAAANLAAAIHSHAGVGGFVNLPGTPPVPTPIG